MPTVAVGIILTQRLLLYCVRVVVALGVVMVVVMVVLGDGCDVCWLMFVCVVMVVFVMCVG